MPRCLEAWLKLMWRVFPESLRADLGRRILVAIARDPGSAGSESGSVAAALHSGAKETTYRIKLDSVTVFDEYDASREW